MLEGNLAIKVYCKLGFLLPRRNLKMNFQSWNYSIKKNELKKRFKTISSQSKEQIEEEVCTKVAKEVE